MAGFFFADLTERTTASIGGANEQSLTIIYSGVTPLTPSLRRTSKVAVPAPPARLALLDRYLVGFGHNGSSKQRIWWHRDRLLTPAQPTTRLPHSVDLSRLSIFDRTPEAAKKCPHGDNMLVVWQRGRITSRLPGRLYVASCARSPSPNYHSHP